MDPRPFTLRELQTMVEGKIEFRQNLQADLMAIIYNCHAKHPIRPDEIYKKKSNYVSADTMKQMIREVK